MPIAAANLYDCFIFRQNDIRLAGKVFNMEFEPETVSMQE
jgi:hypothetical protein